ncbi:hypothetical protein CALCODRAFT_485169 [Calocera cornea HHB12733]|uniref:Uncharacterized protein n=1 Tax=Calocera cornea HHB12733 TaxID=1353952 RepID=A0A165EIE0_9BASI|nr:hypothetical protein CALCODRAFT_485169 [Calocera cornea HHB12733]
MAQAHTVGSAFSIVTSAEATETPAPDLPYHLDPSLPRTLQDQFSKALQGLSDLTANITDLSARPVDKGAR